MLPIDPENEASTKISFAGSQLFPPSVDRVKNVWDLNDLEWMIPWSDACVLPPGVMKRSQAAYTKLEFVGSAVIDCLSRPFVLSSATAIGSLQCSPKSVDFETRIALWFGFGFPTKLSAIWYRSPFGANETHGSEVRKNSPPEQALIPGMTTRCQVAPLSWLTLATSPRAPPSLQRSCWYSPTTCGPNRVDRGSISAPG
jgi:hypothetical protein